MINPVLVLIEQVLFPHFIFECSIELDNTVISLFYEKKYIWVLSEYIGTSNKYQCNEVFFSLFYIYLLILTELKNTANTFYIEHSLFE